MSNDNFNLLVKRRFIDFCASNKITQRELASRANISPQSIGAWFNMSKDTMPTIYAINYLMNSYALDTNWLIGGKTNGEKRQAEHIIDSDRLSAAVECLTEQLKEVSKTIKNSRKSV